ncbi:MAG: aldo/keto reductase [Nitrospirae bacterium]|nr:aldo/keto reductase [Nitrospirota bacterium]
MRYRLFGKTGLYVSELCLGTMTFSGKGGFWGQIGRLSASEAETLIGAALDSGVNLIDTADAYSEGESEKFVGSALASLNRLRDQVIVATKVHLRMGPGANQVGLSRAHIFAAIDASLRRLKLDFIDLYQIHGCDLDTPVEETVRALDDLVRSGKVRYAGFCNLPAWVAMKAVGYADDQGLSRFVSAQMYYSIAGRDIEREVVPMAIDQGLAILPWSPLAGGLLSGKFDPGSPGPEGARRTSFDFPPVDMARAGRVLKVMRTIAGQMGISVARVALAWLLTRPFVTSVIVGAKSREQLADNLAASEVRLAPEHTAELDEASALPSEYPGWMVERQNRDRRPQVS